MKYFDDSLNKRKKVKTNKKGLFGWNASKYLRVVCPLEEVKSWISVVYASESGPFEKQNSILKTPSHTRVAKGSKLGRGESHLLVQSRQTKISQTVDFGQL